jgi:poly(beta-D-mannuronate) lyase
MRKHQRTSIAISLSWLLLGSCAPASPGEPPAPAPPASTGGSAGRAPVSPVGGSSGGGGGASGSGGSAGTAGSAPATGDAAAGPDAAIAVSDAAVATGAPLPDGLPPCLRSVPVANQEELTTALAAVMPGDCLVIADGAYTFPTITAQGTAANPIVLRAANRLKVAVTGNVLLMGAAYVVVEGFSYSGMGSAIAQSSNSCRITRSRFQLGVARATGTSKYTRIDRNEFGPKDSGNGHYIHATEMSEFTQIDRNYLHDASGGGTSRDAVSLGCCGPEFDYHVTGNIMEYNLMVNCSSDPEYVSIKSSGNTVRYNTFRRNGGTLTLRAGRKNEIHGNFILGGGGIRAYEDDHKIWNNYIETGTALRADGDGGGHAPLRRAIIVHNTFLGGVTIGGSGHTIANNIGGGGGMGNLSQAAAGLMRKGDLLAITASSAAVDKAVGAFPFVTDDLHGQPRDKPDIGADEWSTAAELPLRRPLTPADVGPDAP